MANSISKSVHDMSNSDLKHFDLTIDDISLIGSSSINETNSKIIETKVDTEVKETRYKETSDYIVNSANKLQSPTYSELLEAANVSGAEIATSAYNLIKQAQSAATEKSENITAAYTNTITESSAAYTNGNITVSEANNITAANNTLNANATLGTGYSDDSSTSSIAGIDDPTSIAANNVNSTANSNSSGGGAVTGSSIFANVITTVENFAGGGTIQSRVAAALDGTPQGITNAINQIGNAINTTAENRLIATNALNEKLLGIANSLDMTQVSSSTANSFFGSLGSILETMASVTQPYEDGVSETSFGKGTEDGWKSFLGAFTGTFFKSTPLDSQGQKSLYGNMMLGSPFLFNERSDPRNRTLINTLIKDGRYITFTPGMPKYNGSSYNAAGSDKFDMQTKTPQEMLKYLETNGLTKEFSDKDKRYYTFKTDYETYYSYLDAMLNTIWVKMGLGKTNGKFNIFSFFNDPYNPSSGVIGQYKSSIGFFTNIAGTVSESVDNQITGIGAELAGGINGNSDDYQRMNYITGMGRRFCFPENNAFFGWNCNSY